MKLDPHRTKTNEVGCLDKGTLCGASRPALLEVRRGQVHFCFYRTCKEAIGQNVATPRRFPQSCGPANWCIVQGDPFAPPSLAARSDWETLVRTPPRSSVSLEIFQGIKQPHDNSGTKSPPGFGAALTISPQFVAPSARKIPAGLRRQAAAPSLSAIFVPFGTIFNW